MIMRGLAVAFLFAAVCGADGPLEWERIKLTDRAYEAASVCDINNDGKLDIVSGAYWYVGPDFKTSHKMCDVQASGEYFDDFADYPMDVNGDGYVDIVTGGWFGQMLRWRENPKGKTGPWKVHDIDKPGNIETIRFWDIDGDGHVEALPNAGGNVVAYRLVRDASGKGTGKFAKHVIKMGGVGHGMGFGDVNGDGRGDVVIPDGWLEAPAKPLEGKWIFHADFKLGTASNPIIVYDVNGDKLADLIVGAAHPYGLYWMEQKVDGDKRIWTRHDIDMKRSQYHDVCLHDIDNDGTVELITGKRYRAHCGKDPGANDPLGLYYFEINGGKFDRVTLDYGPPTKASGAGIYLWVEDVDGNGWKDIVAPGKEGLHLFKNHGKK